MFGLFAAEDIILPTSGIKIYYQDELVATATTDADGVDDYTPAEYDAAETLVPSRSGVVTTTAGIIRPSMTDATGANDSKTAEYEALMGAVATRPDTLDGSTDIDSEQQHTRPRR